MNAFRSSRRKGASLITHRPKQRARLMRTRVERKRYAVSRRRRAGAWANAMLTLRTAGWLGRRFGRIWIDEYVWRSRRRLGDLRR